MLCIEVVHPGGPRRSFQTEVSSENKRWGVNDNTLEHYANVLRIVNLTPVEDHRLIIQRHNNVSQIDVRHNT